MPITPHMQLDHPQLSLFRFTPVDATISEPCNRKDEGANWVELSKKTFLMLSISEFSQFMEYRLTTDSAFQVFDQLVQNVTISVVKASEDSCCHKRGRRGRKRKVYTLSLQRTEAGQLSLAGARAAGPTVNVTRSACGKAFTWAAGPVKALRVHMQRSRLQLLKLRKSRLQLIYLEA